MLDRHFSADYINHVANHPSVRGGTKIDTLPEKADFAAVVADLSNIVLAYDGGCFLLMLKEPGVYEVHTMTLKHGRGKVLRDRVIDLLDYVFNFAHAERLESMAFTDNQAAVKLAGEFLRCDREVDGIKYYSMNAQDYQSRRAA